MPPLIRTRLSPFVLLGAPTCVARNPSPPSDHPR